MNGTRKTKWIAGDVASWMLGVTLGVILGLALLILTPRLLRPAVATTAATTTTATTTTAATTETPATTPAPAAATETPAAAGDAEKGQALYASATCVGCHGPEAKGAVGPTLVPAASWTDAQFMSAVREGKSPTKTLTVVMPHFTTAQISDADIANIHAYLKTLK